MNYSVKIGDKVRVCIDGRRDGLGFPYMKASLGSIAVVRQIFGNRIGIAYPTQMEPAIVRIVRSWVTVR